MVIKGKIKRILLVLISSLMILTTVIVSPMTSNRVYAATTHTVKTWSDFSTILPVVNDGDIIQIENDLAADSTVEINKSITIQGKDDKAYTIYQKKADTYNTMFKVTDGELTFGNNLILSGSVVECTTSNVPPSTGSKPNNHKLEDYEKTEGGNQKVKLKIVSGYASGNYLYLSGTSLTWDPGALEFDVDNEGRLIFGGNYVGLDNGSYQCTADIKKENAVKLYLYGSNPITSVTQSNSYRLIDEKNNKALQYNDSWNGFIGIASPSEADEMIADSVTAASTSTYYLIPNKKPLDDPNNLVRYDDPNQATNALNNLNNNIDPIPFWYVPGTNPDVEANRYYSETDPALIAAMEEYNRANSGCTFNNPKCANEINAYTKDSFDGDINAYDPKGFFIHVENGKAILDGAILENFITSREKEKTPKYVAPVVASGTDASFELKSGKIRNNIVGYIVDDNKANESADTIKDYIKGAAPNAARKGTYATKDYRRNRKADIDDFKNGGELGSGITATAGAIIYAKGAKGLISGGFIEYNRGDTGAIVATGSGTEVNLQAGNINNNVGVQFGGGITTEADALVNMSGGTIKENVAWFGGGGVYATENGVEWLLGKTDIADRKDGKFVMSGGSIESNTAFTRGGGFFVDSDGVSLLKGTIKNNMSRMLGGGMYVMGDHPDFTYTVYINKGYVHENRAVSSGSKERNYVAADTYNQQLSRKLQAPCNCALDSTYKLFDGYMDKNSDDMRDGYPKNEGSDGTGGGVWLCAYGNTILNVGDKNIFIDNNYASGSVTVGKAAKPNKVQEQISSNKAGGNDIHKETKGPGNIVIFGIVDNSIKWYDENNGEHYTAFKNAVNNSITDFSLINLTNVGEYEPENYSETTYDGVDVFGNISRRGGGLAADGTFVFGKQEAIGEAYSELAVTKTWVGGIIPEDVTIRINLEYEENGKKKNIKVMELPLKEIIKEGEEPSELDASIPEGSMIDTDGNVVYLGHVVLPVLIKDENGKQIQLFDLISNDKKTIEGGAVVNEGETFALNSASGLIRLGRYIKAGGTITLSNATRKLTFTELKDDGKGNLIEVDGYELTPSEMKLSTSPAPKFHEETIFQIQTDGSKKPVGTIIKSDIRFEAGLYNDKPAEIEKYVNKAVHKDIELDEEFEYDILAYVKHGTDKIIIEDELVEELKFVSTKDNIEVVYLDNNNSYPKNNINNEVIHDDASVAQAGTSITNKKVEISSNNKLTITIENKLEEVKDVKGNIIGYKNATDGQDLKPLWGKWVKVTYKARIKESLQKKIMNGDMSITELKNVTIKANEKYKADPSVFEKEDRPTPNIGNEPVKSNEDHNGIDNTASYTLEIKNEAAFKDESNTVTVKPVGDYKTIKVTKIWDDFEDLFEMRPANIKVTLFKDGSPLMEAILNDDNNWKYTFKNLSEEGKYEVEEEVVDYYITTIDGDDQEGFEITNTYRDYLPAERELDFEECGEYTLTKKADGNVSKEIDFKFKISMIVDKGLDSEKKYEEEIKLKVGESKTYDFVYNGTEILVEEIDNDQYDVTYYLDDIQVYTPLTIIKKGKTSNFDIKNTLKPSKNRVPKTSVQ